MSVVLFQPHSDDAVLFAAYSTMITDAQVITVLRSQVQQDRGTGITQEMREVEDVAAMGELGVTMLTQWPEPDNDPDWEAVKRMMEDISPSPETVFAPAVEEGGHHQHNLVGQIALGVFGPIRVVSYLTYIRGHGHSDYGTEVVPTPKMIAMKLRALACYESQIIEPSTRPWFYNYLDMREFIL